MLSLHYKALLPERKRLPCGQPAYANAMTTNPTQRLPSDCSSENFHSLPFCATTATTMTKFCHCTSWHYQTLQRQKVAVAMEVTGNNTPTPCGNGSVLFFLLLKAECTTAAATGAAA